jgi:ribosomal protein S18 acetylase RimI-like enzyme
MEKREKVEVIVRPLKADDTGMIYGHFCDLSARSRAKFRPHEFTVEVAQSFTCEVGLTDPDVKRFVAVVENNGVESAAGYCFLSSWQEEYPWVGIAVSDKWQGMGVGKSMMDYMILIARQNGRKGLHLNTDKDNIAGQKLYKSCGFVITGEGKENDYKMMLKF